MESFARAYGGEALAEGAHLVGREAESGAAFLVEETVISPPVTDGQQAFGKEHVVRQQVICAVGISHGAVF